MVSETLTDYRTRLILETDCSSPPHQSSAVDLKTKEEKDAELDKRIEALRKKNEALVKRYQVGILQPCFHCWEMKFTLHQGHTNTNTI